MESKISIIVPVYNVEGYIRKCLDSILNQTYKNFEVILINDGTLDNSYEICKEYKEKDERIKLFNNKNMGVAATRNFGIEHSTGDYITFIDSDDYVEATYLEKMYKIMCENDVDIVISDFSYIFENEFLNKLKIPIPKMYDVKILDSYQTLNKIYNYNKKAVSFVTIWGNLIKKELYEDIRFPVNKIFEDELTTYKLYLKANKIAYYNEVLYYYVQRSNSIVNTKFSMKKAAILDAFEDRMAILKEKNYDYTYSLVLSRYYAMLYYIKASIIKNNIDYDISIIDEKIKELDNLKLDNKFHLKPTINRILEKHLVKWVMDIYSKF